MGLIRELADIKQRLESLENLKVRQEERIAALEDALAKKSLGLPEKKRA